MMEPKFLVVKLKNEVIVTSLASFYLQYLFHFLREAIVLIRVEVSGPYNKMENLYCLCLIVGTCVVKKASRYGENHKNLCSHTLKKKSI